MGVSACSTESAARERAALAGLHAVNDHHIYCFHMRGEGLMIEESRERKGSQVFTDEIVDKRCHLSLAQPRPLSIPSQVRFANYSEVIGELSRFSVAHLFPHELYMSLLFTL